MSAGPLVSIIVNNYNYGRYLGEAIESALVQTYARVEVIVVDDGSTDHSCEVIAEFGSRVVPVLKENGGQASAFNAGFVASRGEVVIFLDADDKLLPETAGRVSRVFEESPDTAKVEYRLAVMDQEGSPTGELKPPAHLPLRSGDLRRFVLKFPYDLTWMATSGNAFAAGVLREILPVPEQAYGPVGADWYISHLTTLFGPVVFLEEVGAYYRTHQANNYEADRLNLAWVRQNVRYMSLTNRFIMETADRLDLPGCPTKANDLLSVSYVANRAVSYKLARSSHPLKEDRLLTLFAAGLKAAAGRFDTGWPMKVMFVGWFGTMLLAPRPLAFYLAEVFFYPARRRSLNRVLGRLHRRRSELNVEPGQGGF